MAFRQGTFQMLKFTSRCCSGCMMQMGRHPGVKAKNWPQKTETGGRGAMPLSEPSLGRAGLQPWPRLAGDGGPGQYLGDYPRSPGSQSRADRNTSNISNPWAPLEQHWHETGRHQALEDDGAARPGRPRPDPAHWPPARVTSRDPPPEQSEVSQVL